MEQQVLEGRICYKYRQFGLTITFATAPVQPPTEKGCSSMSKKGNLFATTLRLNLDNAQDMEAWNNLMSADTVLNLGAMKKYAVERRAAYFL